MISIILPYWQRQEAANKALTLLAETYKGLDLEVIIVDDGSGFVVPDVELNIKVVRLPHKDVPKCPATAWNAGVEAASGEYVVLSCVEILHKTPVIPEMVADLKRLGRDGYVLAAAWCPEESKWHCHSTISVPTCPDGTGIAFCAALHKELFLRAGGFDPEYRDGAGYEDRDFIQRLCKVGAKFVHRDDLVVTHPKSGASISWPDGGFARNQALYFSKWPVAQATRKPVNFVCLKAGTAYGPEYVNTLYDMVRRNLSEGYPGRFWCITDNAEGLHPSIEIIALPDDLEGWWGKLWMFSLFHEGERALFMDLDTVITGNLDWLFGYSGEFATLRDFFFPERLGPAVIAWKAGPLARSIWDEWEACGKPRNQMGDLWWLNQLNQGRFPKQIDKLQDLFPGKFASFKVDCNPYPPKQAAVVCFHGQPKPDNCGQEWVSKVWQVNGWNVSDLQAVANTDSERVANNIRNACSKPYPWLGMSEPHQQQMVIVCGGPSLADTLPEIKMRMDAGQVVLAVNGAAQYLNDKGITPDYHLVIDSRPHNARFMQAKARMRLLASQCDPSVFDAADKVTLFHMNTAGIADILPKNKEASLVSSGTTAGLAAMAVGYMMGFRALHLHGFDGSYSDNHHAYAQPENDEDAAIDVLVNDRKFKAAPWMVKQAQEFQTLAAELANDDTVITVAGSGLIPYIAKCMSSTGD